MSTPMLTGDASNANLATALNDLNRQLQGTQVTQLFKDDTGMRRVLLGKGNDGFYGLKVSKTGFDVFTAEDTDLIFTSDRNNLVVAVSEEVDVPAISYNVGVNSIDVDSQQTVYNHNLGRVPLVVATFKYTGTDDYFSLPNTAMSTPTGTVNNWVSVNQFFYVDDTDITFVNQSTVSSTAGSIGTVLGFTAKFYLLTESVES